MKDNLNPNSFVFETTTIWDFPVRGNWSTHKSDYRGNFAPQIPRNIINQYSKEGELVLDPMVGSGTTLIEARLMNRNAIGIDINPAALEITNSRINFKSDNSSEQKAYIGDVRNLEKISNDSIDLIVTHPPYFNLVTYSDGKNPKDLSSISNLPDFIRELRIGIKEMFRVLKADRYCSILIGDTRKGQHLVPLASFVLNAFLLEGFILKEQIIKTQHNTKFENRWRVSAKKYNFYLIMHEHLYVFRKPKNGEKLKNIIFSTWEGMKTLLEERLQNANNLPYIKSS